MFYYNYYYLFKVEVVMIPTPVVSHAGRGSFSEVYEPAEDSFLLIDVLERDAERLRPRECAVFYLFLIINKTNQTNN